MAKVCVCFDWESCWFSLGAAGVFNSKVQCAAWWDGLFYLGYIQCVCLQVLYWPFAQEKEMDEESGTFLLKRGLSSLTSLALTSCSRAKPRAQRWLDTQYLWMARWLIDISWWIGCKREVGASQIWIGPNQHHSPHLQPRKALWMLVNSSCLCSGWFHCLADYPELVQYRII